MSKIATFTIDSSIPEVAQAVSLALVMLRRAKVDNWGDLAADPEPLAGMYLTFEQKRVLAKYAHVVTLVGYRAPRCTIALCDSCNEPLILTGAAPSKCSLTLRCEGKYSKVQPGKLELVAPEDLEPDSPWEDDEPDALGPPAEDSPWVEEGSVDSSWPDAPTPPPEKGAAAVPQEPGTQGIADIDEDDLEDFD